MQENFTAQKSFCGYLGVVKTVDISVYQCYSSGMRPARRTPNVRISPRAHRLLQKLAKEADQSMQAILDKAIESYRREEFLRAANREYAALRRNAKGRNESLRERELWDQTLGDGLDKK